MWLHYFEYPSLAKEILEFLEELSEEINEYSFVQPPSYVYNKINESMINRIIYLYGISMDLLLVTEDM